MSESVVPALPDLDALRARLVRVSGDLIAPVEMTDFDDPKNARHNMTVLEHAAKTAADVAYYALSHAASLQRERDELRGLLAVCRDSPRAEDEEREARALREARDRYIGLLQSLRENERPVSNEASLIEAYDSAVGYYLRETAVVSAPTREALREQIARSIYHTQGGQTARFPWPPSNKKRWFQRADAVLAALAPSPEQQHYTLLADALGKMLVKVGVLRDDVPFTGLDLLNAASAFCESVGLSPDEQPRGEALCALRLGCENCGYVSDIPRGYGVEEERASGLTPEEGGR